MRARGWCVGLEVDKCEVQAWLQRLGRVQALGGSRGWNLSIDISSRANGRKIRDR